MDKPYKNKIAAVVVTYNRKELLKGCITSLRNQTRKLDEIIVVNNDSTDGTKEWLDEQKDLTVIHQANLGGAGGFHTGIKTAYEKGYDWIWCMDDDCLPQLTALGKLLEDDYGENIVLNSVVVAKDEQALLNFGIYDETNKHFYIYYNEINNFKTINTASFFNGTLFNKHIISKVGLPNPYYFIYGDEYEFYLRIKSSNVLILTVVESIVEHPKQKYKVVGKGLFKHKFNYISKSKIHFFPRNIVSICFQYKEFTLRRLLKIYVLDILYIIILQRKPLYIIYYIKGIIYGVYDTIVGRYKVNKSQLRI